MTHTISARCYTLFDMQKLLPILLNSLPIILMIGLIPYVKNDYILAGLYSLIILISLHIKRGKNDFLIFIFGFVIMIVSEYLFVSTGVETFNRASLFKIMPIWLPFLWGYGFIAIARGVKILEK